VSKTAPPLGVPIAGEWDVDTGVSGRVTTGSAARAAIKALGDKLDEHTKSDQLALAALGEKLETYGETLTGLRIEQAGTRQAVEMMTEELRHARRLQLAEVKGDHAVAMETAKHKRAATGWRWKAVLALIGVAGTLAGAFAHWLTN
jgi:hypothetical protein